MVIVAGGLGLLFGTKALQRLSGPGFELSDRLADVAIEETDAGPMVVVRREGAYERVSPQVFIAEVKAAQLKNADRGWVVRALDITSWTGLMWIGFGFAAQFVFMCRMLIQWFVSERAKRSIVPEAFWWLSLIGSSMLLIYFAWRIEPVGFVGQMLGWMIYVRNLWMIKRAEGELVGAGEPASGGGS